MSNINKQTLRSTSDRDWFEDWFKREFHPDKTGPYIKDQLFFAVRAARAPLLDELERKDALIAEQDKRLVDYAAIATKSAGRVAALEKKTAFLKERLAQLANFNPGWDMLEAATDSLREHMSELTAANKRIAELEARTVTVRLPERKGDSDGSSTSEFDYGWNASAAYRDEQWKTALTKAGINLTVEV